MLANVNMIFRIIDSQSEVLIIPCSCNRMRKTHIETINFMCVHLPAKFRPINHESFDLPVNYRSQNGFTLGGTIHV